MRFLLLSFLVVVSSRDTLATPDIEKVKTAFVYNFAKYIEWTLPKDAPFTISLVGKTKMQTYLMELSQLKTVSDHKIEIRILTETDTIPQSNIVILESPSLSVENFVKKLSGRHALTIAEGEGYAERGVMINFYLTDEGTLRFEANRRAAETEGIHLGSQILKLARLVD